MARARRAMLARIAVAVAVPALGALLLPGAAGAHSQLTSASPGAGAVVPQVPRTVRLSFSDTIEPQFSIVTLSAAGGPPQRLRPAVAGPVLMAAVPANLSGAGRWRMTYRVVSVDGHPISGTVSFTVASHAAPTATGATPSVTRPPPGTATAGADPAPPAGGRSADGDTSPRSLLGWTLAAIGGIIALGAAVWMARDRSP